MSVLRKWQTKTAFPMMKWHNGKGQFSRSHLIPNRVRDHLGLTPGSDLDLTEESEKFAPALPYGSL